MKKYKKLLLVAPLACMLGTGIITLPNATYADSVGVAVDNSDVYLQGKEYTPENLAQSVFVRLRYGIENSPELRKKFKIADDEAISAKTTTKANFNDVLKELRVTANGLNYDVNPSIDSYEDLGQTNLLTIDNSEGIEKQSALTPEKTESITETISYTNQVGGRFGFETSTTLKVNIPFNVGGVEQNIKASTDFHVDKTKSKTNTKQTTITFKSQPVIAAPGGKTIYYATVKKAKFSGTLTDSAYVAGEIPIKLDIVKKDNIWGKTVHTEEITLTAEDIYAIFKNDPNDIPLPQYLSLDEQNKKLLLDKATFTIKGEGGYYTEIKTKFIPKDSEKKTQEMPYEEYKEKVQKNNL